MDTGPLILSMEAAVDRAAVGYPCGYVLVETDQVIQDALGGYFYDDYGLAAVVPDGSTTDATAQRLLATFLYAFQQSVQNVQFPKYLVWRIQPELLITLAPDTTTVTLAMRIAVNFPYSAYLIPRNRAPFLLTDDATPADALQTYYDSDYGPGDYCQ